MTPLTIGSLCSGYGGIELGMAHAIRTLLPRRADA